ncbi:MAG: hypothetical protein WCB19_05810 [Thermoplasmata archaeon]
MGIKIGKNRRPFYSRRHHHDESCQVVPAEDRETVLQAWDPVMFERWTEAEVRAAFDMGRYPVDVGPRLAVLRKPVAPRTLPFVVTWDEWNAEAEKPTRGYDAEIQRGKDGVVYAHVRSKPNVWEARKKAYWLYVKSLGPKGRSMLRAYKPKGPGQARAERRRAIERERERWAE